MELGVSPAIQKRVGRGILILLCFCIIFVLPPIIKLSLMPFLPTRKTKKEANKVPTKRTYTSNDAFLRTRRWLDTRQNQLHSFPYCEAHLLLSELVDCVQNGHIDHIIPRSAGGDELHYSNLMTLCASCHNAKTRLEQNNNFAYVGEHGSYLPAENEKERILKLITEG